MAQIKRSKLDGFTSFIDQWLQDDLRAAIAGKRRDQAVEVVQLVQNRQTTVALPAGHGNENFVAGLRDVDGHQNGGTLCNIGSGHSLSTSIIPKVLWKEFKDRLFGLRKRTATGAHEFDTLCAVLGIEHGLTPPKSPQTNGMVERFNGRIEEILQSHHVRSGEELENTLHRYA